MQAGDFRTSELVRAVSRTAGHADIVSESPGIVHLSCHFSRGCFQKTVVWLSRTRRDFQGIKRTTMLENNKAKKKKEENHTNESGSYRKQKEFGTKSTTQT